MLVHLMFLLLVGAGACHGGGCTLDVSKFQSACDYKGLVVTSWDRTVSINCINCDMAVDKNKFINQPEVNYPTASEDETYTLIMIDPDVPGFEDGEYWLHWIVSNIAGSEFKRGYLEEATEVAEYNKPEPPPGSGAHRYMFLVFQQVSPNVELSAPSQRPHFRLDDWLNDPKQRSSLCQIVAGIQFRAPY